MKEQELLRTLAAEIACTTGCTDPGSVCLAAAAAAHALGCEPQRIEVLVSPNIFKNGVSVGIPGTGRFGLKIAAALGALLDCPEGGLDILSGVSEEMVCRAEAIVAAGAVTVWYEKTPDPLYVKATVYAGDLWAEAEIAQDYSNIISIRKNGAAVFQREQSEEPEGQYPFLNHPVQELYDQILATDPSRFLFLLEAAKRNQEAALQGLNNPDMRLGRLLRSRSAGPGCTPLAVTNAVQAYTAAAGEARMRGMDVTIMAIAGSGNHGITNFVGVLSAAEELGASPEQTAVALAISSMITIYIKSYIKRMTAFCGCGVAAATGMAAAVTYLLGGNYFQAVHAMQTVIGTLGGIFCDGAKNSCAYKLSTAAAMAVQAAYLAMEDCYVPAGEGIIGQTIEQTFANIGRLNNPGMAETDRVMVSIISENRRET